MLNRLLTSCAVVAQQAFILAVRYSASHAERAYSVPSRKQQCENRPVKCSFLLLHKTQVTMKSKGTVLILFFNGILLKFIA